MEKKTWNMLVSFANWESDFGQNQQGSDEH